LVQHNKLQQKLEKGNKMNTCIEPSPMPPTIRLPSKSHAQAVTGILEGRASLGLTTCTKENLTISELFPWTWYFQLHHKLISTIAI
jgi:hypothetical protein